MKLFRWRRAPAAILVHRDIGVLTPYREGTDGTACGLMGVTLGAGTIPSATKMTNYVEALGASVTTLSDRRIIKEKAVPWRIAPGDRAKAGGQGHVFTSARASNTFTGVGASWRARAQGHHHRGAWPEHRER